MPPTGTGSPDVPGSPDVQDVPGSPERNGISPLGEIFLAYQPYHIQILFFLSFSTFPAHGL